jgi:hypothetical protein
LVLATLRRQALESLIDMSRWKSPGHAQYPFIILGRVGNIPEDEIQKAWAEGHREVLIEKVLRESKQRPTQSLSLEFQRHRNNHGVLRLDRYPIHSLRAGIILRELG